MDRFLPGVPREQIEEIYNAAPGKEIVSGKFDSPESSAALAANTFGFFLNRPGDLPSLPGCEDIEWSASSLGLEKKVSLPWRGGTHPILDVQVDTSSALIGIESKRFEPFRDKPEAHFSDAYWRDVWGDCMSGYQGIRDALRENGNLFRSLKADQLVKHAWACGRVLDLASNMQVYRPSSSISTPSLTCCRIQTSAFPVRRRPFIEMRSGALPRASGVTK